MNDFNSKLLTREILQQAKHITQENPKKNVKRFVKLGKIVIPLLMNHCLMENVGLEIKLKCAPIPSSGNKIIHITLKINPIPSQSVIYK